jgi:DNA ligase-1
MNFDKIYKKDATGKVRVWWAEAGEDENLGHWRTHSGTLNGVIITSIWKWSEPKSQSNAAQQAIFNATAEMSKKLKIDYKTSIDDVDETRYSSIRPMLANEYVSWVGPCFAQPKLDGMRCLANKDGLWTRTNKKIISTPHIEAALKQFFIDYPDIVLDGELYNHDLRDNFNMIMSLCKKTKPTFEDLERSANMIEYWVFDMADVGEQNFFSQRWDWLQVKFFRNYINDEIVEVPTKQIYTKDDLDVYYQKLLEAGYEGQMIRIDAPYEEKRTSNLLKRKDFLDKEYELIDIESGAGNWDGLAKRAICVRSDGQQFGAGISGTQEFCQKLLYEKNRYKSVTVRYQALTPDGIPRFPIAVKFYEESFGALKEYMRPKKDLFS